MGIIVKNIPGDLLDSLSALLNRKSRSAVFSDDVAQRDFITDIVSSIRKGNLRMDILIASQIKSTPHLFRVHDAAGVAEAVIWELLNHDSEIQEGVFSLLNLLPEKSTYGILSRMLAYQSTVEVLSRSLRSAAALRNRFLRAMLIRKAEKRIKKGIPGKNIQERQDMLRLVVDLPVPHRRKIYKYIFRSAFSFHNVQVMSVRQLESLSEKDRIFFSERIIKLKDADEKLIIETLKFLPGLSHDNQVRFLIMMFKNAPYDSVALRLAGALQSLPKSYIDEKLYKLAYRAVRRGINLENDDMRTYGVSLISLFPEVLRKRLILKAFQSDFVDSRLNALKHIILFSEEIRYDLLRSIIQAGDQDDPEKRLLSGAVRMIGFVHGKDHADLSNLATDKLIEIFETIRKDTYRYESLRLISVLEMFSHIPSPLADAARSAMVAVLHDNKRNRQLLAVDMMVRFPLYGKENLFLEGLKSEYEDVILALKRVIRYFPEEVQKQLKPYFVERLVVKRVHEEVRNYSLNEIRDNLKSISEERPIELFEPLNETRIFSAHDLYRYLHTTAMECGMASERILNMIDARIRSDNEKIRIIHNILYPYRSVFSGLDSRDIRSIYRIFLHRLSIREKGLSGDMGAILSDLRFGLLNLKKDGAALRRYIREEGIRVYNFRIYEIYRDLNEEQANEFVQIINRLVKSILNGTGYNRLKKKIENSGIDSRVDDEFVFAILLQMLPIDSSHLSRSDAWKIFLHAISFEDEILNDLMRISYRLVDPESGGGIRIQRPSCEVVRKQSRYFQFEKIQEFLSQATAKQTNENSISLHEIFRARTREDCRSIVRSYIMYHMYDQLVEVNRLFDNLQTRYEALNAMMDMFADTFRDILRPGIQQIRSRMEPGDLIEELGRLQERLNIELPMVRYVGGLKPGALARMIKKTYLQRGKRVSDFMSENVMHIDLNEPSRLNWTKFVSFLDSESSGYIDKELSSKIRQAIVDIERESYEKSVEKVKLIRNPDPLIYLFERMHDYVWNDLKDETERALHSFDIEEVQKSSDISYQIGKSAWLSIYGGLADICIAKDTKIFSRDNFTLLSMIQNERYVGFNLLHFVEDDGQKIVVIAGCEPSNQYASRHSPVKIYEEVVDVVSEMAKLAGYDRVVQIADENAYSNRDKIKRYIQKKIAKDNRTGLLKKPLYLGSFGVTAFRSQGYYVLRDLRDETKHKADQTS